MSKLLIGSVYIHTQESMKCSVNDSLYVINRVDIHWLIYIGYTYTLTGHFIKNTPYADSEDS